MEKSFDHLKQLFNSLQSKDFVTFHEVKTHKKITGVYIVYSDKEELLYIGSTNNFHVRFGTDLRHESTHTLIKKLIKHGIHLDRLVARDYFANRYKYKFIVCKGKREAEALEHLAIWMLDPLYNNNYEASILTT